MLDIKILGTPPNDNALWVTANGGQSTSQFLFDCGADTLQSISHGDIQTIDHLFISHSHMDHISGFDAFFRINFQRSNRPNHIWGPPGTAKIISHRFQGFWWSHSHELKARWYVHDIHEHIIETYRFEAQEAFSIMHDEGSKHYDSILLETPEARVEAIVLKHHGKCIGYVVRENDKVNVDHKKLKEYELKPGPWLKEIKDKSNLSVTVDGKNYDAEALRTKLCLFEKGDSAAYLTDFVADEEQRNRITPYLKDVKKLYAEAQYSIEDSKLAIKNHHSTVDQIAKLAGQSGVEEYILLHLSRRYNSEQWGEMLKCAQAIFPNSKYIPEWNIG